MGWKGTLRSISAAQRRAEREALKRQRELERQQKQLEKMQELERASYEVQVYENYIEVLTSIQKDCSDPWNWESIKSMLPPVEPKKKNTNENLAQTNLDTYKPGIGDRMLRRVDTKRNELAAAVEDGIKNDEQAYQDAMEAYKQAYAEWQTIRELATRILSSDIDAFADAIRQADPFSEINQLGSAIRFVVNEDFLVEATIQVNGEDVVPSETKTLLKSGKLSVKKTTKTKFYELYQDYVCGAVLRIARELFALLPVEMVIVTAMGELLNTKTGHMEELPILSVAIPRQTLNKLNFDLLDPSDSLDNFLHRMKFLKTKGFQAIERIQPSDIEKTEAA